MRYWPRGLAFELSPENQGNGNDPSSSFPTFPLALGVPGVFGRI
jgi:hypothetical protein